MKLTIEDILRRLVNSVATQFGSEYVEFHNKSIARTAADIQAYVKQEMERILPEEENIDCQFCKDNMFCGVPENCGCFDEITQGLCIGKRACNSYRSSILTAIENYGKEGK